MLLPLHISCCVQVSILGDAGIRFSGYDDPDATKAYPQFELKVNPTNDVMTLSADGDAGAFKSYKVSDQNACSDA